MARFDVYVGPAGKGYLLDVQADLLAGLNTRLVVPLMPVSSAPAPAKRLNPAFAIKGEPHIMVTQFLAAVPKSILREAVANLQTQETEVTNALDMAFFGF